MAGTLTAQGRTGRETSRNILRGARLMDQPLSYRKKLAEIPIRRLIDAKTVEENLLAEVVMQAIRDIGIRTPNDSLAQWHRGDMNVYLDAFGVEPECVIEILKGCCLWNQRQLYPRLKSVKS